MTGNTQQLFELHTGADSTAGACIVLVRTDWNASIVDELEAGARRILQQYGIDKVITLSVPGAVEIPFAVKQYAKMGTPYCDAFITLGCVIRGDTPHFDYVCQSVTMGVTQLNLSLDVPVIFGVLTVNDAQQALERIGGKHGHKGEEAAITALKMIAFNRSL